MLGLLDSVGLMLHMAGGKYIVDGVLQVHCRWYCRAVPEYSVDLTIKGQIVLVVNKVEYNYYC